MIFYEIELLSVPNIIHACSVDTDRYKNRFDKIENFLELAILERGSIVFDYDDGTKEITSPGMSIPMFSDISCSTYLADECGQRHSTVGVYVSYNMRRHDSDNGIDIARLKERISSSNTILIPYHEQLEDLFDEARNIIKKIASLFVAEDPKSKFSALGQWFTLAASMTDFVMRKIDIYPDISPSEQLYVSKACRYIHKCYAKKLTVAEIAAHLNISSGYLHRIFKRVKNTSVLEYINRHRVSAAIELINNRHISLKEAAYNVGIDEPAYMSRLFKKVTGISYHEYFGNKDVP